MSFSTLCPKCRTSYQLGDQQAGKKVRCKQCQSVFVAGESPSRPTAIREASSSPTQVRSRPSAAAGRAPRDEPEEMQAAPQNNKASGSSLKWIIGGVIGGLGLLFLMCGGGIYFVYLQLQEQSQQIIANNPQPPIPPLQPQQPPPVPPVPPVPPRQLEQPVKGQPVEPPANPPPQTKADNPPAKVSNPQSTKADDPPQEKAKSDRLSSEAHDRAKRATVYLRVKLADGSQVSGSGFFGCKEARNIILTNAHVVGMLSADSANPLEIEVFVNSGQPEEWTTKARVLGVDRSSDLAVLDIGEAPKQTPEPLAVRSAGGLHELDTIYIFGFPLGEQLGKEITIAETKVTSLRRKNGVLDRVQVGAGMNPGNSGGPLIDTSGTVVGVAVAGIPGRAINFAIPGERVHAILDGRISELAFHTPYYGASDKVLLPTRMEMIDPRNQIKEVGVEIWVGDKPADANSGHRPPSRTQPAAKPGDSARTYFPLRYHAPQGSGDIPLPQLPAGKVYWKQPRWINSKGEKFWASADPLQLTDLPVHRKPANLVLHYQQKASRQLELNIETTFKVSQNEEAVAARIRNVVRLKELVLATGAAGTQLRLMHQGTPKRDLLVAGKDPEPHPMLEDDTVRTFLRNVPTLLQIDKFGHITRQPLNQIALLQLQQSKPEHVQDVKDFYEVIQDSLESLTATMPSRVPADPGYTWQAERRLPIDLPHSIELGKLNVNFTYLGVRRRDGRDEAVISMDGQVRGKNGGIGGKATGEFLVDLISGQTLMATTTVVVQLQALIPLEEGKLKPIRLIATMKSTLKRKLS